MTKPTAHAIPLQPTSTVRLALASVTALVLVVVVVLISPLTGAG